MHSDMVTYAFENGITFVSGHDLVCCECVR